MAKWFFYVLVFVYMCYRAVYGARSVDTSASISVDQIRYEENGYLNAGSRKTINCRASNKNQKLEWVDPLGEVVKRIPSNRVYTQEHFVKGNRAPSLVLTFTELQASDTGAYKCRSGDQVNNVAVCVIDPLVFVDSEFNPTELTVEAGRSITLGCQAKGDPEPWIEWARKTDSEDDSEEFVNLKDDLDSPKYKLNKRYKVEGYESLLTIADVEPGDAGAYHCIAMQRSPALDNCTTAASRNLTLQVNYKPQFKNEGTKYVYGKNSEIVNVVCAAEGWPTPTYRWFKDLDGGALYEFDKSKIVFYENTAILTVTAGPTTFNNVYKCTASNTFGDADKSFKLMRREKPSKADRVETVSVSRSLVSFNISWDGMDFPVDSISVQYIPTSKVTSRIPDKSDWNKAKQVEIAVEENEESEEGIIITLTELEPETEYFVRVRAVNEEGEAPWSETKDVTTTNEEKPATDSTDAAENQPKAAAGTGNNNGMFYGIFFTGGILIVAVVCMLAMRWV